MEQESKKIQVKIDHNNSLYPYSIIWTALPCITFLIPSIGHTGIGNSEGIIHDFAGSNFVSIDNFAFGKPIKYLIMEHSSYTPKMWDDAIRYADKKFQGEEHNLISNNCHHHVAEVLNQLKYKGKSNWSILDIWWLLISRGKYVSFASILKSNLIYLIVITIIILVFVINYTK